jgi:tRNA A37 methylthiotransferase MiaB
MKKQKMHQLVMRTRRKLQDWKPKRKRKQVVVAGCVVATSQDAGRQAARRERAIANCNWEK